MKKLILAVSLVASAGILSNTAAADEIALAKKSGCFACHSIDKKIVGPGWKDVAARYKGKDAKQLRAALVSAIESNTLVEFTFRDDSVGTRNYYVDVTSATGIEYTGHDERGSSRITLVEP